MSLLTVNKKAVAIFAELKKVFGESNVKLWEIYTVPSPRPVGDKVRFYINLGESGSVYIDALDNYKIVKKDAFKPEKDKIDEIRRIVKQFKTITW